MSVNLSSRQFEQPDLVEQVTDALEQSGIHPSMLLLEITEGTLMRHRQDTDRRIRALHQLGVGFALDDFGTGYLSLSHLKRFPLSAVKIDRSFVTNLGTNPQDKVMSTAIITLAHGLGLAAVAEGIETREQREFLT
jgi:EAL domain-containing protein (putative c-di-GMP-specific phosphodiesterase class I)